MTTIAYRDGVLAADTLITCGNNRDGSKAKIIKAGQVLAGAAGSCVWSQRFLDWVAGGCVGSCPLERQRKSDCTGIMILPDGRLVYFDDDGPNPFRAELYTLGSGGEYALGAMAMGASAEQAVRVAIQFDTGSGGEVQVLRRG